MSGENRDQHTPGPWTWDENDDVMRLLAGPMQILKAPKRGTPYAEYWPEPANARLIAAAPDLLEALQLVDDEVSHAEGCGYEKWRGRTIEDRREACDCFRRIVRAAIAKATQTTAPSTVPTKAEEGRE